MFKKQNLTHPKAAKLATLSINNLHYDRVLTLASDPNENFNLGLHIIQNQ